MPIQPVLTGSEAVADPEPASEEVSASSPADAERGQASFLQAVSLHELMSKAQALESLQPVFEFTGWAPKAALQAARRVVKGLLGNIKPTYTPGRDERMRALVEAELNRSATATLLPPGETVVTDVHVDQGFGKPLLITVDLVIPDIERELAALPEGEKATLRALAADVLDRVVRVLWDNPEVVPVSVRGRILVQRDPEAVPLEERQMQYQQQLRPGEVLVADMRTLGYRDEVGRGEDLYARFGSPASDPTWRP